LPDNHMYLADLLSLFLAQVETEDPWASPWFRFAYLPLATAFIVWLLGFGTEFAKKRWAEKLEKDKAQIKLDAQLKELLNVERIKAVSFFASEVEKLREGIHSGFGGGGVLAWVKPYQEVLKPNADVIKRAESNVQLMNEIDRYVNQNALLLGKDIVLFWVKYQQALQALAAHLMTAENEMYVGYSLGDLRTSMYNDLTACLERTVGLPAKNLANAEERSAAHTEGHQLGNALFKETEKKWRSGQ
jgi:hypothetical protein